MKTSPMHPSYLDANTQKAIAQAYRANPLPSVQLQGFLTPDVYLQLTKAITKAKYKRESVPDRYERDVASVPLTFFSSNEFKKFIKKITGKTLKGKPRVEVYEHRCYTLRNDEEKPPGLFVYFDCTPNWNSRLGGATIVSNAYGELARVQPLPNTLVVVDCSKAWPFVQYVNHYAEKSALVRIVFS